MRVLFAISPGIGHLFPTVPLAWALRSAGHRVLVATTDDSVGAAARAGLPAVDVAPDVDVEALLWDYGEQDQDPVEAARDIGAVIADAQGAPESLFEIFSRVSDAMVDGMVETARRWRPDVIVHSILQAAGPVTAKVMGVPAVEHGFGFLRHRDYAERYLRHMVPAFERHGAEPGPPRMTSIHVAPPSMMLGDGPGWPVRYTPYHQGGVLPDWLTEPATGPRVAVTLGTFVPHMAELTTVERVLEAAGGVPEAEFVFALGDGYDTGGLTVPGNVRFTGWVPLDELLATCDAVVHHGGCGSVLGALTAGLPQLTLPHGADQFLNARILTGHGVGLEADPGEVTADTLRRLLTDADLREAARLKRKEIEAQATPAELVGRLAAFAGRA
ncbi:salmochelin biosynthesis C-glycosyltransferase IroB [Actinomadura viridis]|uniref:UDP:flavonoid glycosyltransferase YjiC (YdhE family) n=1 Tax=Actinomadura viridis TaxID=58110 RepID=A0A931GGM4_9ACTN|nr:nucleotide disphospho-sugar-binding domain-containing protein [Actinomadura viridis]MBG6085952.1 UDP:flavonoid glycosyltransferase YjiC (YdhE family) [Actinomadura viridis]